MNGNAVKYVIANQSADWFGNPFSFGAVQRVDVGIDPYNEMRPSIANRRNSPPFASTVRRGEVTPPYERLPLSLPRADRVVRPYNRLPTPFVRRGQCAPPFIVYTIKKQKENTARMMRCRNEGFENKL